jgi:hypothetical protein
LSSLFRCAARGDFPKCNFRIKAVPVLGSNNFDLYIDEANPEHDHGEEKEKSRGLPHDCRKILGEIVTSIPGIQPSAAAREVPTHLVTQAQF